MKHKAITLAAPLAGQRFDRLLVIALAPARGKRIFYRCVCDCGKEIETRADSLRNGHAKSCGCLAVDGIRSAADRVMEKITIDPLTGCWEFQGARQERGHGLIRAGSRSDGTARLAKAHRVTYEYYIGPIPAGLVLDHAECNNPPCVNPWHLEPVTRAENTRRYARSRTHCRHGHEYAVVGYVQLSADRRMCPVCYTAILQRQRRTPTETGV